MGNAEIADGSQLEGWHPPSAAAFTALATINRHRPRD